MNEVESVIVSVRAGVPVARSEDWFGALCGAFDGCGGDWAVLKQSLATRATDKSFGSSVAEDFAKFVDARSSDPVGLLRQVCERRDELPRLYAGLVEQLDEEDEDESDSVEEWDAETAAQWYEHLTTTNDWAGWSGGGDAEWGEFKEWFLYYAELEEVRDQALLMVERVETHASGIAAGFAALGIETAEPAPEAAPEPVAAAGWGARTAARYVELTSGKDWAGWTGEEADWDLFTQWFLYYAAEDDAHDDARAFVDAVEASADKAKAFADHGITVGAPQAEQPEAAVVPVSAEELEELGITQADLAAADREIDALLASLETD